jgi:hypothetical protein
MIARWSLLWLGALALGCSTASVRQLSKGETEYLDAVTTRVDANRASSEQFLDALAVVDRQYAAIEREKGMNAIAEAKLLESMKAPWESPPAHLQATQRAVILFHLYELLSKDRALFEAEQTERAESRTATLATYDQLATLLHAILTDEKIILQYLEQPKGSQIAGVVNETLVQATAFQAELAKSNDARLQKFAAETATAIERAEAAKAAAVSVLKAAADAKK